MTQPIVVVGAGMAGIAAALRLSERGQKIRLIEKRGFLGGRATSFTDRVTGDEIDNAQHVLLGCCTNVMDLLAQVGTADQIEWFNTFHYIDPEGERHDLCRSALPAPLHFGPALLAWSALKLADRLRVARAFAVLMMSSRKQLESWRPRRIGDWLSARGQSREAVERFWRPIIVSALNEELDVAAALPSLQVFLEGFLPHRDASSMGVPRVGLERLFAAPARELLTEGGSTFQERHRVDEILVRDGRLVGIRFANGESMDCERCIFTIPAEALALVQVSDGRPLYEDELLQTFQPSPILGLHLWFDREVLDLPQAALLDSRLEWVFAKTPGPKAQALGAKQRIQGVFSAGRDLSRTPQQEIIDQSLGEMRRALPGMANAALIHGTVVKENRATMVLDPQTDARRPAARTRIEGLYVAGDWTQSGWPATLEGACRSGRLAAAAVLDEEPLEALIPDLRRGLLARLLMMRTPQPLWTPGT